MLFGLWFLVYGFGSYYVTVVILFDYTPPLHEWRGVKGEEIVSSALLCVYFAVFACYRGRRVRKAARSAQSLVDACLQHKACSVRLTHRLLDAM
jgi:hypothetical protein